MTKTGTSGGKMLKNLAMLLFVAGAAWFVYTRLQVRQRVLRENEGVVLENNGQYQKAIDVYQSLYEEGSEESRERLAGRLAACYVALAEDPALSLTDSLPIYRKAYRYDPQSITNPQIQKLLEKQGSDDR